MRYLLIVSVLLLLCVSAGQSLPPGNVETDQPVTEVATVDNDTYSDANRILMFVTNQGVFGRDLAGMFGYGLGTWYPFSDFQSIANGGIESRWSPLFAAGLWLGGKVNGDLRVAIAEYSSEYTPGPMANGTFQPDRPEFRCYKLYRDSLADNPNSDYTNWPMDQGAPRDTSGFPLMRGRQLLWSVYNDADPALHNGRPAAGGTLPLGVEVRQTVWAAELPAGVESEALYIEYEFINKSGAAIDSFFICLWADPDLGGAADDLIGCDSAEQIMYCYNSSNYDRWYQYNPPAIGIRFLQGPVISSPGGAASSGSNSESILGGLPLCAINTYTNGWDPVNATESYRYMQGLFGKSGLPYVYNGDTTTFIHAGDPVSGTGDLDQEPGEKRMMGTFAPFTFFPDDTQLVVVKMGVTRGYNNINAVHKLRSVLSAEPFAPQTALLVPSQISLPPIPKLPVHLHLGQLAGHPTAEVDLSTVTVNGVLMPDEAEIITDYSGLTGEAIRLSFRTSDVTSLYDPVLDEARTEPVEVTFQTYDGTLYAASGTVQLLMILIGDVNGDLVRNLTDLTLLVNYLFAGGVEPLYLVAADIDCDGAVTLTDVTRLVNALFVGGPLPDVCDW